MTVLNLQITADANNGVAANLGGGILDNNSVLVGHDDTAIDPPNFVDLYAFTRFVSVTVPNAATINSATLGFTQDTATAYGTGNATIYGNDVDNASAPANYAAVVGITQTTASTSADISSAATKSYDVTTIVQEIVNRGGWSSGNALMMVLFPSTVAANISDNWISYNTNPATSATLSIDYTAGGGGSQIKTVNGLAQASVKTFNGLANASAKTWNGVTNV